MHDYVFIAHAGAVAVLLHETTFKSAWAAPEPSSQQKATLDSVMSSMSSTTLFS